VGKSTTLGVMDYLARKKSHEKKIVAEKSDLPWKEVTINRRSWGSTIRFLDIELLQLFSIEDSVHCSAYDPNRHVG
jgi:hypothetical protein